MMYGVLKMGRVSIIDDLETVERLYKRGNEDVARFVAKRAFNKINIMWELGIINSAQAEKFEHMLKVYFRRKYRYYV